MSNLTTQAFLEPWGEYAGREEAITDRQRNTLTSLIFQHIEDESHRESYLAQLSDLTRTEADDLVLEFTMGTWQ